MKNLKQHHFVTVRQEKLMASNLISGAVINQFQQIICKFLTVGPSIYEQ